MAASSGSAGGYQGCPLFSFEPSTFQLGMTCRVSSLDMKAPCRRICGEPCPCAQDPSDYPLMIRPAPIGGPSSSLSQSRKALFFFLVPARKAPEPPPLPSPDPCLLSPALSIRP